MERDEDTVSRDKEKGKAKLIESEKPTSTVVTTTYFPSSIEIGSSSTTLPTEKDESLYFFDSEGTVHLEFEKDYFNTTDEEFEFPPDSYFDSLPPACENTMYDWPSDSFFDNLGPLWDEMVGQHPSSSTVQCQQPSSSSKEQQPSVPEAPSTQQLSVPHPQQPSVPQQQQPSLPLSPIMLTPALFLAPPMQPPAVILSPAMQHSLLLAHPMQYSVVLAPPMQQLMLQAPNVLVSGLFRQPAAAILKPLNTEGLISNPYELSILQDAINILRRAHRITIPYELKFLQESFKILYRAHRRKRKAAMLERGIGQAGHKKRNKK